MKYLLSIVLGLLLALPAAAQDSHPGLDFCLAKADELVTPDRTRDLTVAEHQAQMVQHGINCATFFYKLSSADNLRNPYAVPSQLYLERDYPLVITLLIDDGVSTVGASEGTDVSAGVPGLLARIIAPECSEANLIRLEDIGSKSPMPCFTTELRRLADKVARHQQEVYIQPFHEANGGWYQWGMCADNNSPELLVAAMQHVVGIFREAGADNARFVMNWNRRGCDGVFEDADRYFAAIDELVDAHSVSTYNRCGTAPRYDEERSFADDFAPAYERLIELTDKPIWIAETSTSGQCAARIPWFEEMFVDLTTRFPRVERVTFLLGDVAIGYASNADPIYWGFQNDETQLDEFRTLIERYGR